MELEKPVGDYHAGLKILVNGPLSEEKHVEIVTSEDVYNVSKTLSTTTGGEAEILNLSEGDVRLF
jgi:hypothetical protein